MIAPAGTAHASIAPTETISAVRRRRGPWVPMRGQIGARCFGRAPALCRWPFIRTPVRRRYPGPVTLASYSPATGERLGAVAVTAPGELPQVVAAVARVQPFWAELTLRDRGRYLERAAQVIIDETDSLQDLIAREQGKPRHEAFTM